MVKRAPRDGSKAASASAAKSPAKATRVTNQIRRLRFEAGEMTQAELAERIGVTRQTLIAIEQGRYSPSLETAFRIARAFNAGLDDVFQYPAESPLEEESNQ